MGQRGRYQHETLMPGTAGCISRMYRVAVVTEYQVILIELRHFNLHLSA